MMHQVHGIIKWKVLWLVLTRSGWTSQGGYLQRIKKFPKVTYSNFTRKLLNLTVPYLSCFYFWDVAWATKSKSHEVYMMYRWMSQQVCMTFLIFGIDTIQIHPNSSWQCSFTKHLTCSLQQKPNCMWIVS